MADQVDPDYARFRLVVEETFDAFAASDRGMDGKTFAKACKDCNLIDKQFSAADADIVFAKVVERGHRRIGLDQFKAALRYVAEKKCMSLQLVHEVLSESAGPKLSGTYVAPVRFHDDYARATPASGYPGTTASSTPMLSFSVRDSEDSNTSLNPFALPAKNGSVASLVPFGSSPHGDSDSYGSADTPGGQRSIAPSAVERPVERTFKAFCAGRADMDSKMFFKLCKESRLLDLGLDASAIDLVFTKVRKRQLRISFDQFLLALEELAKRLGSSKEDVWDRVSETKEPGRTSCTNAEAVRFHDDVTTYTGSHRHRMMSSQQSKRKGTSPSPSPSDASSGGSDRVLSRPSSTGSHLKQAGSPCVGVSLSYLSGSFACSAATESRKSDPTFRELQAFFWLKKRINSVHPSGIVSTADAHGLVTGKQFRFGMGECDIQNPEISEGEMCYVRAVDATRFSIHESRGQAEGDGAALTCLQVGNELCPLGFNGSGLQICPRDGLPGASIVDTLNHKERSKASHFVSWTWDYPVSTVTSALQRSVESRDKCFLWMCFFVNNQHRIIADEAVQDQDTLGACFLRNLKQTNNMLVVMDRYREPKYTRRIWTIYEVFEATRNKINMKIVLPSSCLEELKDDSVRNIQAAIADSVHISDATAWSKADETTIKHLIQSQYGGFGFVEAEVRKALSQSLVSLFAEALQS